MKFFKIFSAILFFSFLGSIQNHLLAQEPTKNAGYWGRELAADQYLENGDYRAKLVNGQVSYHVLVVIYNKYTNNIQQSLFLNIESGNTEVQKISFEKNKSLTTLVCTTASRTSNCGFFSIDRRGKNVGPPFWKVLNTDVEIDESCYFQLEEDGRFVIYHGTTGIFGSAGTPIVELVGRL
jgi:hypothetical protein